MFEGKALCFDCEEDMLHALEQDQQQFKVGDERAVEIKRGRCCCELLQGQDYLRMGGQTAGVTPMELQLCQAHMLDCQVTAAALRQACGCRLWNSQLDCLLLGCRAPWSSSGMRAPRAAPACLRC